MIKATCVFLIVETRPTPKVSVASVAGDSNAFELARRDRHALATRLVADVRHVTFTSFVARLADVTFCQRVCQVCDHVIVLMNVVLK